MEHACQQCGAAVEDGRPFCPQCRAPQIHVQIAIPDAGAATAVSSAADDFSPDILQGGRDDHSVTISGSVIDRGTAVRAALKAGVLGVFVGMIPILGIVLTGSLAVYFYRRENGLVLPAALGSRVGAAAGVVSFAINSLLIAIRIFVYHAQHEYIDAILKFSQAFGANVADADVQAGVRNLFTPSGLAITFFFGMIFTLVLASLGGAVASWFLKPRNNRV